MYPTEMWEIIWSYLSSFSAKPLADISLIGLIGWRPDPYVGFFMIL